MGANWSRAVGTVGTDGGNNNNGTRSAPACVEQEAHIHCLSALGSDSILSGGTTKVVDLYCWKSSCYEAKFSGPVKDVTKICYNNTSQFVFAASRDRALYGWKWPLEGGAEGSSSVPPAQVSEPDTVLSGHSLGVTALDSNDGFPQLLCSGSRDNSVCLWDLDVGKPVSSMYAPRNVVTDLKWLSEEKAVVQASEDKTLRVWDLTSCSTVQQFRARDYLQTCCAVSSNNRQHFLAGSCGSANMGGELTLWDRRNEKKPLRVFRGHSESITGCLFGSTNLVVSASKDSSIRLWELDSGQELYCEGLSGPLTDIIAPEDGLIACSSFKDGISLWTIQNLDDSNSLRLKPVSQY